MIFPWYFDRKMNTLIEHLNKFISPVFSFNVGIKGIGDAFTFIINSKKKWNISSYFTTYLVFNYKKIYFI